MKKLLAGIAAFVVSISIVLFIASCTTPSKVYDVAFDKSTCIEPYSDFTYRTGLDITVSVNGELFLIPAGFETDLASIPRWYWMILSPQYSAFVIPSIIHDYFYRCENAKDREFADSVFYYALRENGVDRYTASKFYIAVRLFGGHSYSKALSCKPVQSENPLLAISDINDN